MVSFIHGVLVAATWHGAYYYLSVNISSLQKYEENSYTHIFTVIAPYFITCSNDT